MVYYGKQTKAKRCMYHQTLVNITTKKPEDKMIMDQ